MKWTMVVGCGGMALQPEILTWTGLLAKWMELARVALVLPRDEEGERWRQSVGDVIQLQAVTFALGEIAELAEEERRFALDKAAVLIERSAAALGAQWGETWPESLGEIMRDARAVLAAARGLNES